MVRLDLAVVATPDVARVASITDLLRRVRRRTGQPALSEGRERSLVGAADGGGDHIALAAAVLASPAGSSTVVGYAQLDRLVKEDGRPPLPYVTELAVDPTAEDAAVVADRMLAEVVDEVHRRGGGTLRWWAISASADDDARASRSGFAVERSLLQLRCRLPLPPRPKVAADARRPALRPFVPGEDERAWLDVNNRAFAGHPEQGGWDLDDLFDREREPWFDPSGFLVVEEGGRLAGFCWTKVHRDSEPPVGEIYVIGVDPPYQGRGWGRSLTQAGLDWLAGRGVVDGMLYVDAANRTAVSMYRSMGFEDHHVDRAYLRQVGGATGLDHGDPG